MNEYILDLTSIDYFSLISAIIIIMGAIVATKELIEKFCRIAGIEFSWIKAKNEMRECQTAVKRELAELQERQSKFEEEHEESMKKRNEFNKEIIASIVAIKNEITKMNEDIERREALKKFEKLRDDILDFANDLPNRTTVSEELITNIYNKINMYNRLHNEYKFENSQAPVSIEVIKQRYQEMLKDGKITKRESE